jgi:gliding motility-associated-like protein
MKKLYTFLILIFFISKIFSQEFEETKILIKDHNGHSGTINVDCDYNFYSNKSIELSVDYPILRQTDKYQVSSIQYPENIDFSKGTPVATGNSNGKNDDVFGNDIIDIGFNFCFYGNMYNQIIVSDNGVVSFDLSQKNKECPYYISGNNPSSGLPKNSIFGVYHDMNNTTPSKVKVTYEGRAPYRKFIINFDNLKQYGPDRLYSSSQIVLYETLNIIDIYVGNKSKNPRTPKDKNALIGLINSNGYVGISPPGRNKGDWEAKKEAWRFTPNGKNDITVAWYQENSSRPNYWGNTNVVSPTTDTYYRVKVTYNGCNSFTLTDTIYVKFTKEFPTAKKISPPPFCINKGESYTVNLKSYESEMNPDPSLKFTYYRDKNLTKPISDEEAKSFTFSDDMTVYVKVLKSGVCYIFSEINLKLNKKPDLRDNQQFIVCDENNDDKESVNLYKFKYGINTSTMEYIILDDKMRELPDVVIQNFPIDLSGTTDDIVKFYLKAWNKSIKDKGCYTLISFTVKLIKKIELENYTESVCNVREGQSIMMDLTKFTSNLLANSPTNPSHTAIKWRFFRDKYYQGEILNPDNCMVKLNTTIYVKATHPDFCEDARAKLTLKAEGNCGGGGGGGGNGSGIGGLLTPSICNAHDMEEVDLESYLPNFLSGTSLSAEDIEILGFYNDVGCTSALELKDSSPGYIYEIKAPAKPTIYLKYKIKKSSVIAVSSITIFISKNQDLDKKQFDICDIYNDKIERIFLKDYEKILKDLYTYSYPYPSFGNDSNDKIVFFDNPQDRDMYLADNTHKSGMIDKYFDLTSVENPKIIYPAVQYNRCSYAYDLEFNLVTIEEEILGPHIICDFNDDRKEIVNILEFIKAKTKTEPNELEKLLTSSQLSNLITPIKDLRYLKYYKTKREAYDGGRATIKDPTKFEISYDGDMSAFVKLEVKNECPIIVEIKFNLVPSVKLPEYTNLEICDIGDDNKEEVNLSKIVIDSKGTRIQFYRLLYDAEYEIYAPGEYLGTYTDANTPIMYMVNLTNNITNDEICMRVEDPKTKCFKIIPVKINLIPVPRVTNPNIYICDFENNGIEEINSSNLEQIVTAQLIKNNSQITDQMEYEYYLTEKDAKNESNPIDGFDVTNSSTIWVKIKTKDCSEIFELKFSLIESPVLKENVTVTICNNNTRNDQDSTSEDIWLNNYNDRFFDSGQNIEEYEFTYFWSKENAIKNQYRIRGSAEITQFPTTFWVRVKNTKSNCFSIAPILVDAYPELEVNHFVTLLCNEEKKVKVNLKDYPSQMLGGFYKLSDFNITYHASKYNAIKGIEIPNANLENYEVSGGDEVWVKFIYNKTGCYIIRKIEFLISLVPKANVHFIDICDETDGNIDGNYIISNLDDYKTDIIIGESRSFIDSEYEFTYYRSLQDAQEHKNEVSPVNFTIKHNELSCYPPDNPFYTIHVRIDKKDKTCPTITAISVNVNPRILLDKQEVEMMGCMDDQNKSFIDLTSVSGQISSSSNAKFEYYKLEKDARKGDISKTVINPQAYQVRTLNTDGFYTFDEVFVRVKDSKGIQCDSLAKIKIKIYPYLKVQKDEPIICEYEPDGHKTQINLWNSIDPMLSQNGDESRIKSFLQNMRVIYRDSAGKEIGRVEDPFGQIPLSLRAYEPPRGMNKVEIKVQFENKVNGCGNQGIIQITQKETPRPNKITYTLCDEDLDGEYNDVLLKDLDKLVITQAPHQEITYYRTQSDALSVLDSSVAAIDKDRYFTVDFIKPLYVRVLNKITGCIGINEVWFKKNTLQVSIPKEVKLSIKCDDSRDDSQEIFDLHESEKMTGNFPARNYRYYRNETDAKEAFKNEAKGIYKHITEPEISNYTNRKLYKEGLYIVDEIYVRIKDEQGKYCDGISKIKLYVYPYLKVQKDEPIICEYEPDGHKTQINLWNSIDSMLSQNGDESRIKSFLQNMRVIYRDSAGKEIGRVEDPSGQIPLSLRAYEPPRGMNKVEIKVQFENKENGCGNQGIIQITQKETPRPELQPQFVCDGDNNGKFDDLLLKDLDPKIKDKEGHNYLDQRKYKITYHEGYQKALSGLESIDKDKYFTLSDNIYIRVKNLYTGCIGITKIEFETNDPVKLNDAKLYACDGDKDGYAYFQLPLVESLFKNKSKSKVRFYRTEKDANDALKDEAMGEPSKQIQEPELSNYKSKKGYVYVRVDNLEEDFCPSMAKVELIPYVSPTPPNEIVYICPRYSTTLNAGDDGYDQIRWYFKGKLIGTGQYLENVRDIGVYTVEHTKILNYNLTCTTSHQIEVKLLEEPVIVELQQGKDYITVIANGPAPLEYSIDKVNWQRNNTFANLKQGIYTFYVRSVANSCEAITSKGIIFAINNVITPNGDNYNDVWRVCGLDLFNGEYSQVKIFDRYGKQVFEERSNTCFIWDGKHLGRNLPTSSYWYVISIADGREFTGWIMLRNYNENDK